MGVEKEPFFFLQGKGEKKKEKVPVHLLGGIRVGGVIAGGRGGSLFLLIQCGGERKDISPPRVDGRGG